MQRGFSDKLDSQLRLCCHTIDVSSQKAASPEVGTVRLIVMTERQFQNAEILSGEERPQETEIGSQLDIFL